MSGGIRYVDDLIGFATEAFRGRTALKALSDDITAYFGNKSVVTSGDFNDWLRAARAKPELAELLRDGDVVRALQRNSTRAIHRQDFMLQFERMLGRGVPTDAQLETLRAVHKLEANDQVFRVAQEAVAARRAAGATPPASVTPPPPVVDDAEEVARRAAAGGETTPAPAVVDDAEEAARRTAAGGETTPPPAVVDDAEEAARRTAAGGNGGTGGRAGRGGTVDNPGRHGHVEGRVMAVNFEHWVHRLAAWHPSSIFRNIPFLRAFSLGSLKHGLPNIGVMDHFIRPAIAHLDNTFKSTGVMDAVNGLQRDLGDIVSRLKDPSGGAAAIDNAKQELDQLLRTFARENGDRLDAALVQVNRLMAELDDGKSVLGPKYAGMAGLSPNQASAMRAYLEDMRTTLTSLKEVDGQVAYSRFYQDEITRVFSTRRSNADKAETLANLLNSRFNRLGRDVSMRADGVLLDAQGQIVRAADGRSNARPLPHRVQGLERQLNGGAYNQYDRAESVIGDNVHNIELAMFQMLEHYKFRKPGDDSVEATNKFIGWINEFYNAGADADANRTIRVLIAEMGGNARETYPKGLLQRIESQEIPAARNAGDLNREQFWRNIRNSLMEIKDRPTAMGPREVERVYYAPFAKFWLIATGYPLPKSWNDNLLTGFSVPTTDRYLRYPAMNSLKEGWAYLTGGRTIGPAARMEGELVIDAAHSVRKFKYDWLPRFGAAEDGRALNTGLLGRGTDRSLFGVLGRDGVLDRLPWYLKMPMNLASGGMLSTQSRVGLTLPGKVLVGGAGAAWGLEQGTAALGWGNDDGQPGWQTSFDPRGAINTLQSMGLSFYDGVWDHAVPLVTLGNVRLDVDRGMPFSDLSIRNWVLSWTERHQDPETQRIGADLRAKADDAFNGLVADYSNIKNLDTTTAQLMQRLQQEAAAARQRNETEKATKLEQLYRSLESRATAITASSMGADTLQMQSRQALETFRRSSGPLEARQAVTALEDYRTQIGASYAQTRAAHQELRRQIQAVPEAAALLTGVPVPAVITPEQVRAESERQAATPAPAAPAPAAPAPAAPAPAAPAPAAPAPAAPAPAAPAAGVTAPPYIGPAGGSTSTTTGTPEQQLTAIKAEAARAVRETQQSVAAAAANVDQINNTVREILQAQEFVRNNNGNAAYFDNALVEVRRLAQEAEIARQAAVEASAQLGPLATEVNAATTANIADARAKLERMTPHAQVARESQNRAARSYQAMQRFIESNRELSDYLHQRRQTQRVESITGTLDGGNNGILSNLTRSRGQPGGESFLGQMFNSVGNAFAGVRDWWTRDVARAASRSEGGKMMYQAANIGLGGIAALLAISTWNSTIGKWTGTEISGGLKLLVVGGVLLYMLRGSSAVGDTLDRMGGRYTAGPNDYSMGTGNGPNPFTTGAVSGPTQYGAIDPARSTALASGDGRYTPTASSVGPLNDGERSYTGTEDRSLRRVAHTDTDEVFPDHPGGPRTEALVGQSESAAFAPAEAQRTYGRVTTVAHSQDTSDRTSIFEFGRGGQDFQPAFA